MRTSLAFLVKSLQWHLGRKNSYADRQVVSSKSNFFFIFIRRFLFLATKSNLLSFAGRQPWPAAAGGPLPTGRPAGAIGIPLEGRRLPGFSVAMGSREIPPALRLTVRYKQGTDFKLSNSRHEAPVAQSDRAAAF